MTNDASPSSFVKFMDVPVTMTREHIHDCLKDNRKWSTVDISNVEIFAIKNKDSTIVNVLKIKFKDDAQSSTAKRVLTTMHTFKHRHANIINIGTQTSYKHRTHRHPNIVQTSYTSAPKHRTNIAQGNNVDNTSVNNGQPP
ncbi:hypothetical protein M378DRAFT_28741 [Amanita muscaria Koide BX008]|uniref:Uncharacterized protein n=1 Tax=Amanita muscaria (strain Koide BX008) TaxID=946122 RepID=A0A0C2WCW4_AMAMK|nr:hypothetical protein M378DRAFT_28741 [Amanita muscaria Koide BX008]